MSESQNRLTPDLVVMAIETGMLDASLPALRAVVNDRLEIVERRNASELNKGDRFLIKDCSPKKWNDVEVEFQKHDGQWLVCWVVNDSDLRKLNTTARTVRLRTSHVGTFTHRAGV